MKLRNLFWIFFTAAIIAILFLTTDPRPLLNLNPWNFLISNLLFLSSAIVWAVAWNYVMKDGLKESIILNLESLTGFFAPAGIGADFLRAYFSKRRGISATKALSASFTVKFFKFIIAFFLLLLSILLLAVRSDQVPKYLGIFVTALFLTMGGAIFILFFRMKKFMRFFQRRFRSLPFKKLYSHMELHFSDLLFKKVIIITLILLVSTVFEIFAIDYAFKAINYSLPLLHIFIFSSVINSLILITFTPQGIGFVEAGGFFVLSIGYFAVAPRFIGSFLIVWNLVRLWIPAVIGGIIAFIDRRF